MVHTPPRPDSESAEPLLALRCYRREGLMDLQLGVTLEGQRVTMSEEAHRLSTYLVGRSRHGKSHVMAGMIRADLEAGEGLVVIDPHGTLIRDILPWIPTDRLDDVYLLDCGHPTDTFGLNLFDMGAADSESVAEFVSVFRAVWSESWGTWMEDLLSMIGYTALYNPTLKITDIPQLLAFGKNPFRDGLVSNIKNRPVRDFWDDFGRWQKREWEERTRSTVVRIRPFITNPRLRAIVGQDTTIDLTSVAWGTKILLVNLNESVLRDDRAVSLLGSLLVNRIINELRSRSAPDPVIHLYADEVHRFTSPLFSTAFNEMGKFGLAPVTANQMLDQLNQEQRSAMIGANSLIVFSLGGEGDARVLAEKFRAEAEYPEQVRANNPWAELNRGRGRNDPVVRDAFNNVVEQINGPQGFGRQARRFYVEAYTSDGAPWLSVHSITEDINWLTEEVEKHLIETRDLDDRDAIEQAARTFCKRSKAINFVTDHRYAEDKHLAAWKESFVQSLIVLHIALAEHPIWSPEWEAAQINGPKRTVTEIFNEHINQLATLPRWHAWVSIGEREGRHEYRMRTLPPEDPPPTPWIDTGPYTSPRDDVLREMDQSKEVEKVEDPQAEEPRQPWRRRVPLDE